MTKILIGEENYDRWQWKGQNTISLTIIKKDDVKMKLTVKQLIYDNFWKISDNCLVIKVFDDVSGFNQTWYKIGVFLKIHEFPTNKCFFSASLVSIWNMIYLL